MPPSEVDRTGEVFADIVCSDPDWVDAEFEAIISGFWDRPTPTSAPAGPRITGATDGEGSIVAVQAAGARPRSSRSTIRSPP